MKDLNIAPWRWCAFVALWLATNALLAWIVTGGFQLSDGRQAVWAIILLAGLNLGMAVLLVGDLWRRRQASRR